MTGTMHDKLAKQKKIILKINSWFYWSPVPACTVDAWKKKPRHHQKNSPVRTQNKTNGLESRSSLNVGPAGAKRKLAHVAKAKWTVSLQWIWLAHDWHASCQRNRPDKTRNLATNNNIDMDVVHVDALTVRMEKKGNDWCRYFNNLFTVWCEGKGRWISLKKSEHLCFVFWESLNPLTTSSICIKAQIY